MQTSDCGENYIRYTISRGQTLYAIANQFNTTVDAILQANPALDAQLYYAGDVICIPRSTAGNGCTPYTIRRGDSFYLISQRTGVPLADLLAANPGVDPARLVVGQVICLPSAAQAPCGQGYSTHTVTQGQNFVDILVLYNISYSALEKANESADLDSLKAGDTLCIAPRGSRGSCEDGGTAYQLVEGDTLSILAARYNTSIGALMKSNPTYTPADFVAGRIICLPDRD